MKPDNRVKPQPWNDRNRYSQTGYSSPTMFPNEKDYINKMVWMEDMDKAEMREEARQDWQEELRMDCAGDCESSWN